MHLGHPLQTLNGTDAVYQLFSHGGRLWLVSAGMLRELGTTADSLIPGLKVRQVLPSAERLLVACHHTIVERQGGGKIIPMGTNTEFWQGYDVRCFARYEAEGFAQADRNILLCAGVHRRRRQDPCQTRVARLTRQGNAWQQLGLRLEDFKVRALVGMIFPGPERAWGRIPIVMGETGAYRLIAPMGGAPGNNKHSPLHDSWQPLSETELDIRDAATLTTAGAIGPVDQLVAAAEEGFFEYCPGTRDWILERKGRFSRLLSQRKSSTGQPVVLAAGENELVQFDGFKTEVVASWDEPLRPMCLTSDGDQVLMAYKQVADDRTTHVAAVLEK